MARELGLTSAQIGMVGSLFFLTFTIGGFLAGPLNKYLTLRWALLILAAAWSVVMLPLLVSASLVTLIVGRMLLGLAEGPSSALMHTATYSWHPPNKRGLPGAFLMASGSIGKILLAPVLTFSPSATAGEQLSALDLPRPCLVVCWLIGWQEGPYTGKSPKSHGDDENAVGERSVAEDLPQPYIPQLLRADDLCLRIDYRRADLAPFVFRKRSRLQRNAGWVHVRDTSHDRPGLDDRLEHA